MRALVSLPFFACLMGATVAMAQEAPPAPAAPENPPAAEPAPEAKPPEEAKPTEESKPSEEAKPAEPAAPAPPANPPPAETKPAAAAAPATQAAAETTPAAAPKPPSALDSLPGSPRPPGLSLSPEAPRAGPAPGGRAPSFGAPTDKDAWSFRFGGRIAGYEVVGIGRRPRNAPAGYRGTPIHVPAIISVARQPFWPGAGATLNLQYGNSVINATVMFYARFLRPELNGYANPLNVSDMGQAYLTVTPEPLGTWRPQIRAGAFLEIFGGPGQWGWGIYGPMLAIRGYGTTISAENDLNPNLRLLVAAGVLGVPELPENTVRGTYIGWTETAVSSIVYHAHLGFTYKNQYIVKLHYAADRGTDERRYLVTEPHDGRMDTYIAEAHWQADPYGQLGLSFGLWNFAHANSVNATASGTSMVSSITDAIWWGIDWTQGSRDFIYKYLGPSGRGHGNIAVISGEYDMSLARILWYPRGFDGRGPDVRLAVAGVGHWVLDTDDRSFRHASGYMLGTELQYIMTSWLTGTFQVYGQSRDGVGGRWETLSVSPGLAFHSDWQSTDRIQIAYSRLAYSSIVDINRVQPLDRDVITCGAYITF
jgi:hypothetical protein